MRTMHFAALRRRLLPLAALAATAGLGGCVAAAPAPSYTYGYNYPAQYSGSYAVTTTTYPRYQPAYPVYSPYFHGNDTVEGDNGGH